MATPLTPTDLNPRAGKAIVASQENTFTWLSDGTQAAFYIEYVRNTTSAVVSNTGWVVDSLSQEVFVASTFTNTWEYKWRVKIRNSTGQESSFSDWMVFRAGSTPGVTITFPENDLDVVDAVPVYQHSYNNPDDYYQVAYQYKLFTGTTWNDFDALTAAEQESMTWNELEAYSTGTLLWDSGKVESQATSVEQPSDKLQVLQYWYKVQVTIWDNVDNEITSNIRTFGLLVESVPQIPTISASADGENGRNAIAIVNPTPDVGQVAAHHNKLYRKKLDETWELIQDNITGGTGYDTTCRSTKEEEYAVSAVSADGIESSKSLSAYATCSLSAYWVTNLDTSETVKLMAEPQWTVMQSERGREEFSGQDEQYPSIHYTSQRFYRGSFKATLMKPTGDTRWPDYIAQIRAVLDTNNPCLFRSMFGDLLKVDIYNMQIDAVNRLDQIRQISFEMVEIEEKVTAGSYEYDTPPAVLDGFWIIDPSAGKGMRLYAQPRWNVASSERDRFESIGLTGEMPSINYGSKKAYRSGFTGWLMKPASGTLAELVMKLRELVDGKEKKPLLFRTASGDIFWVDTYGFNFELVDRLSQARKVSFEFIEIGGI